MVVGSSIVEVVPEVVNIAPVYGEYDVYLFNVYDGEHIITKFLNRDIADKTIVNYEHDICEFFGMSDFTRVTSEDILNVTIRVAEEYKMSLLNKGNGIGTIITKIARISALFEYVMINTFDNRKGIRLLEGNVFDAIKTSKKLNSKHVTEDNKVKSYGSYTRQELSQIISIVEQPFDLLFEMAARTGLRKDALLKLKLEDIVMIDGVWCVYVEWDKTKGNLYEAITEEMYQKAVKYSVSNEDGRLFTMSQTTPNNKLRSMSLAIGINEAEIKRRNLKFHSLKKSSVIMASEYSNGNLEVMKKKAHHSDINLTINTYAIEDYKPRKEISLQYDFGNKSVSEELGNVLSVMDAWELRDIIMGMDDYMKDALLDKMIRMGAKERQVI